MKRKYLLPLISVFLLTAMYYAPADAQSYAAEKQRENMLLDAVSDFAEGRYSMAEERLAPVIASDPDNDAAHYYMAMAKFMQEDYQAAEEEFEKAVALDSSNFWYRYRLAAVYAATGRQELTAEIYNGLLEDFPKKSELYYGLIDLYLSMGKMEEALSTLDQIDTVFGKSDISSITRFDILRNLGRIEEAYAVLEEYNREYSSPQVLAMLGDYQMSMYEDSVAMAYYDEALSLAPDYAPAMLGKAEVYRMTRKYDDYFKTLDIFMEDKEIPSEGKCDYFKALVQHSDPNFLKIFQPRLDSVMTACLSAHPGDSSATALAGIYYYGTGREEKSKEYFRENAENWPESLGAAANYMEVLIYTGDWKELSSYTKLAYERFPEELRFLEMSTLADYNLKAYDDVIATCSRIISIAPQDSARVLAAYTTLGDVYYHLGEKSRAYKAYDEALKVNPEYLPVLNNYAYFLSLDGKKLKKACSMSKRTVDKDPDNPVYLDTYGWILYLQGKPAEAKPYFKHAMLYGGKDSAVTLDHYAEVLFDLGEYSLAFVYWNQALAKDRDGEIPGLEEKIRQRKSEMNRDKK